MWINRRSYILLIHLKRHKRIAWYIPIALPVIEAVLDSWRETTDFWERIFPRLLVWRPQGTWGIGKKVRLSALFSLFITLFNEMRNHGPYELVHVESGKGCVSVRLW